VSRELDKKVEGKEQVSKQVSRTLHIQATRHEIREVCGILDLLQYKIKY
jgi:hypothetical protein